MGIDWSQNFNRIEDVFCCPVLDTSNNEETCIGTATYLMPGIFLTAKHVVEGWHSRAVGKRNLDIDLVKPDMHEDVKIRIIQLLKNKGRIVWNVNKLLTLPGCDVSILVCEEWEPEVVDLIKREAFPSTSVDLHLPAIGQPVSALGYPRTQSRPHRGGTLHTINLRAARGGVEATYLNGASLVKAPCFQINAEIEGGMSGGQYSIRMENYAA